MVELSDRKKQILASVIELYIKTGEPVGSKGLISATGMSISSATVRNEMNELDSLGLLEQPHTSAGRIPSQQGYRYYVDNLMKKREIDELSKRLIDAGISSVIGDPEKLIIRAGDVLAELTKCACISTAPVGEMTIIRKIELVPVGLHTAMMVLLTSNGILKSRLCRLDCEINAGIIEKFYNLVNVNFIGRPASEINIASMQTLAASLDEDYFSMLSLVSVVSDLAVSTSDSKLVIGGSSNLLGIKDYGDKAIALLDFLNKKDPITEIMTSPREDINIKIGNENRYKQLESSSVVVAKYFVNGDDSGTIGIIGPTRMDYESIIPSVKYLTGLVGQLITQALEE